MREAEFYSVSLLANQQKVVGNIMKDISVGVREETVIPDSVGRLKRYACMPSIKLDTSEDTVEEMVARLITIINE